jgi:hypothetical protein
MRVRYRPLFSVVAIVTGAIGGLGVLVLLQQAGTVYPTRNVTILAVVLGVAWGIAVPSLMRLRKVRRVNRNLAARAA